MAATRPTYPQNWPAYNAAQTTEKDKFQVLLHGLCAGLATAPRGRGRPPVPLPDAVFAAVYKVYSTLSGRRFMSDLREAHNRGYISRVPCYNTIFNILETDDLFPILRFLVEWSALPLTALEENFAIDSSGFVAKYIATETDFAANFCDTENQRSSDFQPAENYCGDTLAIPKRDTVVGT